VHFDPFQVGGVRDRSQHTGHRYLSPAQSQQRRAEGGRGDFCVNRSEHVFSGDCGDIWVNPNRHTQALAQVVEHLLQREVIVVHVHAPSQRRGQTQPSGGRRVGDRNWIESSRVLLPLSQGIDQAGDSLLHHDGVHDRQSRRQCFAAARTCLIKGTGRQSHAHGLGQLVARRLSVPQVSHGNRMNPADDESGLLARVVDGDLHLTLCHRPG